VLIFAERLKRTDNDRILCVFRCINADQSFDQRNVKVAFSQIFADSFAFRSYRKEVAEKMLRDNGIYDVEVISTEGNLRTITIP
jgi:Zn-dependent membrane protease YugP